MRNGKILESGDPVTLYQNPKYLYSASLLTTCNVVAKDKAIICGIGLKAKKTTAAIYPEWLEITPAKTGDWLVKQVLFKGFYEDILIEKDGLLLRAHSYIIRKYKEGDKISLKINRWLEY